MILPETSTKAFNLCQKVLDIWLYFFLSKMFVKTLDPCQKSLWHFVLTKTTSHEPNMPMDILDRIKFQGPFGMDQMSYGYLDRPNVLQGHWRVLDSLMGAPNLAKTCKACPLAFCSSGTKPSWLTVNPGMVFQHLRLTFSFPSQPLMQLFSISSLPY